MYNAMRLILYTMRHKKTARGFTLIELLVVMGLIALLAGIVAYSFRGDSTVSLRSAQGSLASLFNTAKSAAVLKGADTRVIINFDVTQPDLYGRQIGIIYRDRTAGAGPNDWVALNDGTLLPAGVFVVPPSGPGATARTDDKTSTMGDQLNNAPTFMNINFPRARPQVGVDNTGTWLVYEFDSTGMSNNPGAQVVIASGLMLPGSQVNLEYPNEFALSGVVIRRIGTVTAFNDYDDIQ